MADGQVLIDSKLDVGGIDKGIDKLSKEFEGLAADVKSVADKIDREMDSVDIADSAERELRKVRNSFEDTADKAEYTSERIEDSYEEAADEQSDAFRRAWNDTERYSDNGSDSVKRDMDSMGDKSSRVGNEIAGNFANAFASMASKVGAIIGTVFAIEELFEFGQKAIELGSNLAEVQNVVDVTFGDSASAIDEFAKSAIENFGLSETSAKKFASTIGSMLKSMGDFSADELVDMSTKLTALAGDMASFYNLDAQEAFDKIRAGISGETEPLKQLGINLSVANLEQYALANGIQKSYDKMTEQEKALLRYNYIMQAASDATGDFVRTQDQWANQTRNISENFSALMGTIGQGLINILSPLLNLLNDRMMPVLQDAASAFEEFTRVLMGLEDDPEIIAKYQDILDFLQEIKAACERLIKPLRDIDFGPAAESAMELYKAFEYLASVVVDILWWAYENVLVPLSEWYIEEYLPEMVNTLAAAFELLGAAFELLGPYVGILWDIFKPVLDFLLKIDTTKLEILTALMERFTEVLVMLTGISEESLPTFEGWSETAAKPLEFIFGILSGILDTIVSLFDTPLTEFAENYAQAAEDFKINFEQPMIASGDNVGNMIASALIAAFQTIKSKWGSFDEWWDTNVADAVGMSAEELRTTLNGVWEGMLEDASTLWSRITSTITGWLDKIMEKIRSLDWSSIWNGFLSGLTGNTPASAGPTSYIPAYDPASLPVPYLASGAVIPPNAPFLAILGDQRNGTNIEAPLATIQQALADVLGEGGGDIEVKVTFDGDLAQLGRFLNPIITAERKRRGGSLSEVVTV